MELEDDLCISRGKCQKVASANAMHRHLRPSCTHPSTFQLNMASFEIIGLNKTTIEQGLTLPILLKKHVRTLDHQFLYLCPPFHDFTVHCLLFRLMYTLHQTAHFRDILHWQYLHWVFVIVHYSVLLLINIPVMYWVVYNKSNLFVLRSEKWNLCFYIKQHLLPVVYAKHVRVSTERHLERTTCLNEHFIIKISKCDVI